MRGPIGSHVSLVVERREKIAQKFSWCARASPSTPWLQSAFLPSGKPNYIRLSQFNANATVELAHVLARLEKQGASAYILDLEQSGGLLQAG